MDAKAETKDGGSGAGGGGGEWARDLERPADETVESSDTIFDMGCEKESDSAVDISSSPAPPVRTLPVVFRWKGEAQTIFISGSYDNWKSRMPLVRSQDDFYTVVEVPEGANQYKFLIDGEWRCHPNEPMIDNGFGSQNNIITIKESDCNLCNILCNNGIGTSSAIGGEYSQYIPPKDTSFCYLRSRPPTLPPHLLENILNKELPVHCDPTMVAEPTHVVLNHLYTLSIKGGVMVMSTTHRYRRKYITTLLYRPIGKG